MLSSDPQMQSVVDAQSVFDTLAKDTAGKKGEERTAIELVVVKETMSKLGSQIRWVPHTRMPADQLAQIQKTLGACNSQLDQILEHASFSINMETQEMEFMQEDASRKLRTKQACLYAVEEKTEAQSECIHPGSS